VRWRGFFWPQPGFSSPILAATRAASGFTRAISKSRFTASCSSLLIVGYWA